MDEIRQVPSADPLTMHLDVGENARAVTGKPWACSIFVTNCKTGVREG